MRKKSDVNEMPSISFVFFLSLLHPFLRLLFSPVTSTFFSPSPFSSSAVMVFFPLLLLSLSDPRLLSRPSQHAQKTSPTPFSTLPHASTQRLHHPIPSFIVSEFAETLSKKKERKKKKKLLVHYSFPSPSNAPIFLTVSSLYFPSFDVLKEFSSFSRSC